MIYSQVLLTFLASNLQYNPPTWLVRGINLPSDDPLLVLSLLFPSFFLLFPEDSELVDLLLALSFKEMFRLTGCDADPWFAPSCSSSRSNTKGSKSFYFLTKSIATLDVGEAK